MTDLYIFFGDQIATIFASDLGFKITVEDFKCVQANAFIQSAIFHEYIITEEQITFKINLNVLIVSINSTYIFFLFTKLSLV